MNQRTRRDPAGTPYLPSEGELRVFHDGKNFRLYRWFGTVHLQFGARAAFMTRLLPTAMLGVSYAICGHAYELTESEPREPGREEYLDSEKYQVRNRDLDVRAACVRSSPPSVESVARIRRCTVTGRCVSPTSTTNS